MTEVFLLVFVFIVIIYLISLSDIDNTDYVCFSIWALVGVFFILAFRIFDGSKKSEGFIYHKPNDNALMMDPDDNEHSPHGNISMSRDVDTLGQLMPTDLELDKSSEIDNSDVVQRVMLKSDTHHHPLAGPGFTSSNTPYTNPYFLHEKDDRYPLPEHSYPINDTGMTLDEALAIKQNHIGTMNKRAIDGTVRNKTRDYYQKFFTNELDENASREWWSNSHTGMETDFRPYDY